MAGGKRRSASHSPESTETHPDKCPGGPPSAPAVAAHDNPLGCLLRLYWMGIGNFALVICAVLAARRAAPSFLDGLYALILISLVVARYFDISRCGGQTADGDPATFAHWRRYSAGLVPAGAALWLLGRFAHAGGWF